LETHSSSAQDSSSANVNTIAPSQTSVADQSAFSTASAAIANIVSTALQEENSTSSSVASIEASPSQSQTPHSSIAVGKSINNEKRTFVLNTFKPQVTLTFGYLQP